MRRSYIQIVCLFVIALLLVPQYVAAESRIEGITEVDYQAAGDNDEVQNRLDDSTETNRDTWDPVPSGVYVGGFSKESSMRLSVVPDSNFSVCLAQVTRFTGDQIMSGSSFFTVRLPVSSSYTSATLDIYEIEEGVNWSFEQNITVPAGVHSRNDMRITFTAGIENTSLVAYTRQMDPADESPTDGDPYFTRENRTYAQIRAPIHPDTYYLFVTTAKYAADSYVDVWWQPESLTLGHWNRSTLATYNLIAPDTFVIQQENFNISLGYSFDFVQGFGASSCGYNKYMIADSEISFHRRVDDVDLQQYLTIMFPFQSSITNVSIRLEVIAYTFNGNTDWIIDDTSEWNDFVLVSTTDILDTELPAWKSYWEGWIKIRLTFTNETRYRFYMRDLAFETPTGFNQSWYDGSTTWAPQTQVHAPGYQYDPAGMFQWNDGSTEFEDVHWQIQCSVLLNDYRWAQSGAPGDARVPDPRSWEDMNFLEKIFMIQGALSIHMGQVIRYVSPEVGYAVTAFGMELRMVAMYDNLPDPFGRVRDGLNWAWDKLQGFGTWLYKVGQSIVGALRFIWNLLEIVFAIIILVLAMVAFFTPIFFTVKGAMALRKTMMGRFEEAMDELMGAGTAAVSMAGMLRRRRG